MEVIACMVLGWKVALGRVESVSRTSPAIIEKMGYEEDDTDKWVQVKNVGRNFLDLGRDRKRSYAERQKSLRRAIELLNSIPAGQRAYPAALYNLGTAYRELGKHTEALNYYDEAENCILAEAREMSREELDRRKSDILFMRGRVYDDRGEKAEAKRLYEEAWGIYPNDYGVIFNLYELCKELGETAEATVWYSVLSKHPDHKRVEVMSVTKGE